MTSVEFTAADLNRYLTDTRNDRGKCPPVRCNDGFAMSVQASEMAYCEPRSDAGPWTAVEVGFPNRIEPLLWPWAESWGRWTDTVYGYVPTALVAAVVDLHGGLASK